MSTFDGEDTELRASLVVLAGSVGVDIDECWKGLVATLRRDRRVARIRRGAAVAAVVLLLLTAGRPVVVAGGSQLARFVAGVSESTFDAVTERIDRAAGRRGAHGNIDKSNEFWVEVRNVHDQLNDAVGWNRWERDELEGAAERLEAVAAREPDFETQAREAARLIGWRVSDNDRASAVLAHQAIEDIERGLRQRGIPNDGD